MNKNCTDIRCMSEHDADGVNHANKYTIRGEYAFCGNRGMLEAIVDIDEQGNISGIVKDTSYIKVISIGKISGQIDKSENYYEMYLFFNLPIWEKSARSFFKKMDFEDFSGLYSPDTIEDAFSERIQDYPRILNLELRKEG